MILRSLVETWKQRRNLADQHKWEVFGEAAEEAMRFYAESHEFLYAKGYNKHGRSLRVIDNKYNLQFEMTVNLISNMVQLYLPYLYHKNPNRTVTPRQSPLPDDLLLQLAPALMGPQMMQAMQMAQMAGQQVDPLAMFPSKQTELIDSVRAGLLNFTLNHTPREGNLKGESRKCVTEALVKGRGLAWPEIVRTSRGACVHTFHDSVDHLQLDPDSERVRDCGWIIRDRVEHVEIVSRKFGIPREQIPALGTSTERRADMGSTPEQFKTHDEDSDLVSYFEVYSRVGLGQRFSDASDQLGPILDRFGDNVYLAICDGMKYPLNIPEHLERTPGAEEEIKRRIAWPVEFHEDAAHPWPFVELDYHHIPRCVWPQGHATPAMGYQKLIDWIYSMLSTRLQTTCRSLIVTPNDLGEVLDKLITNGPNLTHLKMNRANPGDWKDIIQAINFPEVNADAWRVLDRIKHEFAEATGLVPLMYGSTSDPQMRSASEAQLTHDKAGIRPEDMKSVTEDWEARVARHEAIVQRRLLRGADVSYVFGEEGQGMFSGLWDQVVASDDIAAIISECEYAIEIGSSRKPNKQKQIQDIDESAQFLLPMFTEFYKGTGNSTQLNAWLRKWGESRDFDVREFMLPDMQALMQQQLQQGQQGPPPQEQPV